MKRKLLPALLLSLLTSAALATNPIQPVTSDGGSTTNYGLAPISQAQRAYAGTVHTIAGSAGNLYWSQPETGASYKKVVIVLSGYTAAGTTAITYDTAFLNTPSVVGNGTALAVSTPSTSAVTVPIATLATGTIVVEGI